VRSERALIALLVVGLASEARGQNCPTRDYWLTEGWRSRATEVRNGRASELAVLEDYALTEVGTTSDDKRIRTDVVIIIQNGEMAYERYVRMYENSKLHISWDMARSVTNVLTGIAAQQGAVQLDDSICKYIDQVADDHCAITVHDLLDSASGLEWTNARQSDPAQADSMKAMLYGEGHTDVVRFVVDHPLRDSPGTAFNDSVGDATLLASVVDAAMRAHHGRDWPWATLFDPLGVATATIERDLLDHPLGGTHFWATPDDYARLGLFILSDGCWAGQRYLPEGWLAASTAVQTPYKTRKVDPDLGLVAGRLWWVNRAVPEQGMSKPWPQLPDDTFAAIGRKGQSMVVIPSRDLLVLRYADDGIAAQFDLQKFVLLAMQVAEPL